jgi:DmsE family decaheme c-type cytochrome
MGRQGLRAVLVALGFFLMSAGVLAPLPAMAQGSPDQVCAGCHQSQTGIANTKHGVTGDSRTPAGSGKTCTACHGDAAAHLQDPVKNKPANRFGKGHDPLKQSESCLSCHQGGTRVHWQGSAHDRTRVSCNDCHSVHAAKDQVLVQQTQAGVCFTCHKEQRAAMMRFSSHPLRSGQMSCSSCHQPHGSVGEHQLIRTSVNDTCYTCHADKRGPFLWEHPPSRENCGECHNPHGSNNAPMLKARGPFLCQQCHINANHPSTPYTGNNVPTFPGAPGTPPRQPVFPGGGVAGDKMLGQNCMNCHPKVHGSNHPSGARFTR